MRITLLGTGSSLGIPVIGCTCSVCSSENSHNKRDRPSILIEYNDSVILVDTSPDFRQQAIRNSIKQIDAVIYTHAHADHIFGLDDLRIVIERQRQSLPVLANQETLERLKQIFTYAFDTNLWKSDQPRLAPRVIDGNFDLFGKSITPIPVLHNQDLVYGYRIDDFAYVTDVSYISTESVSLLEGVDTLIISALRLKPHVKHLELDKIIDLVVELKVKQAYLTHISHEMEHSWLQEYCPPHINPGYDGLVIEI